ncbi:MAG: hypothetical protein IIA45_16090, partial [Bacteroidetes bacterium]|nr:hypothetical protein [Bacteroidota bacterium]
MKQILSLLVFIFLLQQFIQAQTPALVKDILPGKNGSEPKELISIGNTLYFSADDSTYGRELWRSNGTTSNTIMVRDISPGTRSGFERTAFPQFLTNLNGTLYFGAREYQYGDEIWKSDGTTSGTVMIKDINVGDPWSRSLPRYLTVIGNTIYFSAFTYKYGTELWKTDGTESGTVQVKDIREGGTPFGESSFPREYTVLNNTLYFTVNPAYWVEALMKSDGTGGGTEPVK